MNIHLLVAITVGLLASVCSARADVGALPKGPEVMRQLDSLTAGQLGDGQGEAILQCYSARWKTNYQRRPELVAAKKVCDDRRKALNKWLEARVAGNSEQLALFKRLCELEEQLEHPENMLFPDWWRCNMEKESLEQTLARGFSAEDGYVELAFDAMLAKRKLDVKTEFEENKDGSGWVREYQGLLVYLRAIKVRATLGRQIGKSPDSKPGSASFRLAMAVLDTVRNNPDMEQRRGKLNQAAMMLGQEVLSDAIFHDTTMQALQKTVNISMVSGVERQLELEAANRAQGIAAMREQINGRKGKAWAILNGMLLKDPRYMDCQRQQEAATAEYKKYLNQLLLTGNLPAADAWRNFVHEMGRVQNLLAATVKNNGVAERVE